jgi:hypothetical protein
MTIVCGAWWLQVAHQAEQIEQLYQQVGAHDQSKSQYRA